MLIALATVTFLSGLVLLWWCRRIESRFHPSFPLLTAYLAPQHLAFGFGGLLVACFGESLYYPLVQKNFSYIDAWRVFPVHLLSVCAMATGAWLTLTLINSSQRRIRTSDRLYRGASGVKSTARSRSMMRAVSITALTCHATLLALQWGAKYVQPNAVIQYLIDIFARDPAPAAFFLGGMTLGLGYGLGRLFAAYLLVFGVVQFASGNRGIFLTALFLFVLGTVVSGRVARLRAYVAFAAVALVLTIRGFAISEEMTRAWDTRQPATVAEWISRVGELFTGRSDSFDEFSAPVALSRLGGRLFEVGAAVVITDTPETVPFQAAASSDLDILRSGWVPSFLAPDVGATIVDHDGAVILADYGFLMQTAEQTRGVPVTIVADVWRRSGWLGTFVFHFVLGAVLSVAILRLRSLTNPVTQLVFGAAVISVACTLYAGSILSTIIAIPRRLIGLAVYAFVIQRLAELHLGIEMPRMRRIEMRRSW